MSYPTPRTEAFIAYQHKQWPLWDWQDHASAYAEFARKLELELAQVNVRKDWLVAHSAYVAHARDGEVCWVMMRLDEESDYEAVGKPCYTADEAIDAAMRRGSK
jgi:hypothetical protein